MSDNSVWGDDGDKQESPQSPFHFSDFIESVKPRRNFILASSLSTGLIVFLASFLIKDTYESTAVILPPKQDQSISALLAGSGGSLSSIAGGGLGAVSLKNPNEVYLTLLSSRTLNSAIVDMFDLKKYYGVKTDQDATVALRKHTVTEIDKGNVISVTVRSHDADLSSRLTNAFVDQLHDMNTRLALTDSAQRREFYQSQLDHEKILLAQAETELQETQTRTGIIVPSGQADMVSRSISTLRAQITQREAELESMRTFAGPENPDYLQLQAQVNSLRRQLSQLENSAKKQTPGDIEVPTAQLPKSALEYARKFREVQLHEQVYGLLLKQFEAAKLDEAKTAPMIEVIDRAVPAQHASGPYRWLLGIAGLCFALALNFLWCAWKYAQTVLSAKRPPLTTL